MSIFHRQGPGGEALGRLRQSAWRYAWLLAVVDFPPGDGHRGYAAMADGSGLMVGCCCSHSIGDR